VRKLRDNEKLGHGDERLKIKSSDMRNMVEG
jgi:hypothetical protein